MVMCSTKQNSQFVNNFYYNSLRFFNPKLRKLLIYFFSLKKSAAEAHRLLVETYSEALPWVREVVVSGYKSLRTVNLTSKAKNPVRSYGLNWIKSGLNMGDFSTLLIQSNTVFEYNHFNPFWRFEVVLVSIPLNPATENEHGLILTRVKDLESSWFCLISWINFLKGCKSHCLRTPYTYVFWRANYTEKNGYWKVDIQIGDIHP